MPNSGPTPDRNSGNVSHGQKDDTWERTVAAFGTLVERITPWLLDLGNWVYGALIAFNLVILGALLTVGPVDAAVLIAAAAFALALPPDVAGFLLLRLAKDMKAIDLEEVATTAFTQAGFSAEGRSAASADDAEKRRARVVLLYSYGLLALTLLLTLTGVTAALWHMAWWIGSCFLAMVVISQGLLFQAIVATGSKRIWRTPPGAEEPQRGASASDKQ